MLVNETLKEVIKNNNLLYGDKKPNRGVEKKGGIGSPTATQKTIAAD